MTYTHIKRFICILAFGVLCSYQASASISLSPSNPRPRSDVTLTLSSYEFDVSTANITWKVNGKAVLSGQGETVLVMKMGNVGSFFDVEVNASSPDGSSIDETITVTPSAITLLYEAPRSYVPLLYKGRSLPSTGGVLKVTALPSMSDNGVLVSPTSLSYAWYLDGEPLTKSSGRGKQSATMRLDFLKSEQVVRVVVRSPYGNESSQSLTITTHEVMPVLYSFDPLFGPLLSSAFGKRIESTSEFTIAMEPYYVSINDEHTPSYEWFVDGLPTTPLDGRVLGFQPKANSYGSRKLLINVTGGLRQIQEGKVAAELIFDTRK